MYINLHKYSLQTHSYEMFFNSTRTKPTVQKLHEMKWNVVLITKILTVLHYITSQTTISYFIHESRPYADEDTGNHGLIPVRESDMHPDQLWGPTNLLLSWHHGCFPLGRSVSSVKLAFNPHPVETVTHKQQYLSLYTHYTENCWNETYKSFRASMSNNKLLCKSHFWEIQ